MHLPGTEVTVESAWTDFCWLVDQPVCTESKVILTYEYGNDTTDDTM